MFTKRIKKTIENNIIRIVLAFQLIAIAFFFLTIQIWQFHGLGRISIFSFLMGVFFDVLCIFLSIKYAIQGEYFYNMFIDIVIKIFALFVLFKEFSEITSYLGDLFSGIIYVSLSILTFTQLFQLIIKCKNLFIKIRKKNSLDIKNLLLQIIGLSIVLLIIFQFINLWPRWDSAAYYLSFEKLHVTNIFQKGKEGLITCGHPASAYALLYFFVRAISGFTNLNTLYLVNFFLLILDYLFIYCIFKKIKVSKSNYICSILSFVFICSPYILGNMANINPEHICFTGLLMFLLGVSLNNNYICVIACYIVCYSRETGVPVIAFLIFIQLIYEIYRTKKAKENIYHIKWEYYFINFVTGCIWVLIYLRGNWGENMGLEWNHYYADGSVMYKFHFSIQYIIDQLKGIFLTNFTWIYMLFFLCAGIFFVKKHSIKKILKNELFIMVIVGMLVSAMILCLFLTHHNYRYYTPIILFVQIAGICSVNYISSLIIKNKFIQNIPIIFLGVLMFVQCHTTIDPIMLSVFPVIHTGNAKIATMPWNINELPPIQFLECARYNFQPSYFDKALNLLYSQIEQNNSTLLIYDGYQWGTEGNTLNSIWGYGYEFNDPPLWGVWNSEGQYRELSYDPDHIINPIPISDYKAVDDYLQTTENLYYLELPWGDDLVSILREKCSEMELFKTIEYRGWVLNVYNFKK